MFSINSMAVASLINLTEEGKVKWNRDETSANSIYRAEINGLEYKIEATDEGCELTCNFKSSTVKVKNTPETNRLLGLLDSDYRNNSLHWYPDLIRETGHSVNWCRIQKLFGCVFMTENYNGHYFVMDIDEEGDYWLSEYAHNQKELIPTPPCGDILLRKIIKHADDDISEIFLHNLIERTKEKKLLWEQKDIDSSHPGWWGSNSETTRYIAEDEMTDLIYTIDELHGKVVVKITEDNYVLYFFTTNSDKCSREVAELYKAVLFASYKERNSYYVNANPVTATGFNKRTGRRLTHVFPRGSVNTPRLSPDGL